MSHCCAVFNFWFYNILTSSLWKIDHWLHEFILPSGDLFFFFLRLVASKSFLRDIWVKPVYCAEPVGITVIEWWNFKGKEVFAFSGHGSRNPISARSVNERNISELVFPFWYHDVYNMECKVQPDLHLNPSSALMSKVFSVSKPQSSQ